MPKKTTTPKEEPVIIDEDLLQKAKLALESDRPKSVLRCGICGGESAPTSNENLCWVCRRLKISAWRDSDQQIPMQE